MASHAALFLFLAASVIAVFAFVSIAVWVTTHAEERKARDRFALLKTLAEHPGESATRVLEMLRDQEERQAEKKDREERRGFLAGGVVCMATGIGIAVMIATLSPKEGAWTVGLMISLIGAALVPFGLFRSPRSERLPKSEDK
ncbi:MAG: hypothetical protein ACHQNV_06115 [Vicinamibacteria bacterium]